VPVTVVEPGATPVNVTVQVPPNNVQLAPTVPTELSEDVKLTEPDGVLAGFVVSETVAVQVEVPPMLIEEGAQEATVEVLSSCAGLTAIVPEVPVLPL